MSKVHPYDYMDRDMLWEMLWEIIVIQEDAEENEVEIAEEGQEGKTAGQVVYSYADITELEDINEWLTKEGKRKAVSLFLF